MNAFTWLANPSGDVAVSWVMLLAKVTVLLAVAWMLHGVLGRCSPLWRVFMWRLTTVGIFVLGVLAALPALFLWEVLPARSSAVAIRSGSPRAIAARFNDSASAHVQATNVEEIPFDVSPPTAGVRRQQEVIAAANRIAPRKRAKEGESEDATASSAEKRLYDPLPVPRAAAHGVVSPMHEPTAAYASRLAAWLLAGWLGGVLLLFSRVAIAAARIRGICRRAQRVPEWLAAEAACVASRMTRRSEFSVAQTPEVASPCVVGLLYPVILLPLHRCTAAQRPELRAILAHEIAHLHGRDLAWNALMHVVSLLLWFHPLVWRIRNAHAQSCDAIADRTAADYVGDATWYGGVLARLALEISRTKALPSLAMARTSNVRHRIELLCDHPFELQLPRRRSVCASVLVTLAVVFFGGLTLAPSRGDGAAKAQESSPSPEKANSAKAQPDETSKDDQRARNTGPMVIQCVLDANGDPLVGVALHCHGLIAGKAVTQHLTTDLAGRATFVCPPGATVQSLWITGSKTGFVPVHYVWRSERRAVELPQNLTMRLSIGIPIGGIVQDKQGQPIAGANVELTMPVTWPRLANYVFGATELKTDEKGRWHWSGAPTDLGLVSVRVAHPDYRPSGGGVTEKGESVVVLDRGIEIKGRALDTNGKPIVNAIARLGFDHFGSSEPETTSDDRGNFVLRNCKPGKSLVTVQAEGFAPQFQEVTVTENTEPLEFRLEPGRTMRIRVVDSNGKPIAGAVFASDTWRGYRTLEFRGHTDANGRLEWPSAPPDAVLCDVLKTGFMANRRVSLTASDDEHVVTLLPELVIRGSVVDATTRKPIPSFQVRHGSYSRGTNSLYWSGDEGVPFTNGKYSIKFDEPSEGYVLQFVAPGYLPAESSKFGSEKGQQTFDVALKPGAGPTGVVLLPNGRPAIGAEVAVATRGNRVYLKSGQFERPVRAETVTTDQNGQFELLPRGDEPFVLVIVHDEGFAELSGEELAGSSRIKLQSWGQLEGQVRVGKQPDANRSVAFFPHQERRGGILAVDYDYQTVSDREGKFRFDRVIPGQGIAARLVVTEFQDSSLLTPGWQTPVVVQAGGRSTVMLGGTGRTVTGTVQLERQADVATDWTANEPATISRKPGESHDASDFRYIANIDKSGQFSIPDVPAGDYALHIPVNNAPSPNSCGAGRAIGRATHDFTVAASTADNHDEPIDLGIIKATLFDTLDAGEPAPDFVAEGIVGDQIRMSDYRGKLVLLNFWATWCAPCLAEMPMLAEIQKQFGDEKRFVLVGLSCDTEIGVVKKYLAEDPFPWRQGYIGQGIVTDRYTVRAFPATFLIGPNGCVLAKNLTGEKLKEAIAAALKDEALFRVTSGEREGRFPISRFEPAAGNALPVGQIAAVVLDNSDPAFEPDKPHHDRLTAVDDAGKEVWSMDGFNNAGTVAGVHGVALDRQRQRVYVSEDVTKRITALNMSGKKLWQIDRIDVDTLTLDEAAGRVWVSGGTTLNRGETVVFDADGSEVAAYPYRAIDIAFDPNSGSCWLVGYEVIKISREGKVLFRKKVEGWCYPSISVNPTDGSVWVIERSHPDVARSRNRLWLLDANGAVRQKVELGKIDPFSVAAEPKTGDAWLAYRNAGMRRVSVDGRSADPLPIEARQVSLSQSTGRLWAATKDELLQLDAEGKVISRFGLGKESSQTWLQAF
jgi:beta-lactamase regulating signal transducer with metallopeptidase domain/thiol-disulfide isomerase/thioredoxin